MSNNPWGDSAYAGFEEVSDIELEFENQATLLKEQGDLIEFATASEVKATLDAMLVGDSFIEGDSIIARTPIGCLKIFSPDLKGEWLTPGNITDQIELSLTLSGVALNKDNPLNNYKDAFSQGNIELNESGEVIFKALVDFSKGITDFDLRCVLRDLVDYARVLYKRIEIQAHTGT